MLAAGSMLEFVARGTTEASQFQFLFTPGMLQSEAAAVLNRTIDVTAIEVMTNDTVITGTLPWTYTANVSVRTRLPHASIEDVKAIIANGFQQASGNMPTSVTQGHAMDVPGLSWKVVAALGALALLIVAMRVR